MSQSTLLIVEQQTQPPANLPDLLKELAGQHQLDIYQCRQRLTGRGRSLLSKGELTALKKISPLLQEYGYRHWLVAPTRPRFAPMRLRGLLVKPDKITFNCQAKQVEFPKGGRVLAVLAEMSGALADQDLKQLLSSTAYRGRDNVRHLAAHKTYKTILQGEPLLDLYLLDENHQVVDAVRVFPGKFDHRGLGELATPSSKQNLDRLLKLVEQYAGEFSLHTDFGLVNLPGCTLRRENPQDPETQRQNQISLARYGWLLTDLQRIGPMTSAASVNQNPALAGPAQEELVRAATRLAEDICGSPPVPESADQEGSQDAPGLPLPPPVHPEKMWKHPSYWLGGVGGILVAGCLIVADADIRVLFKLFHFCFDSGVAQLFLATLLFSVGFYLLVLKRQIENTPTSKVRSIAMGMVEIKGRALRQFALISPVSHTPCIYYRVSKYQRGQNNEWTLRSVSSSANVPFYLEDDTGRVSIDPAGCLIRAGTKSQGMPGQFGLLHLSDDSDIRWEEEFIVEGTLLYVLGFANSKRTAGPTLNEARIDALRELKRNPQILQQYDSDGDGRISQAEWESARQAVEENLLKESMREQQTRKRQEDLVMIGKKNGRPFIIAETHTEETMTSRYGVYFPLLLGGAVIFAGWGIQALLNTFR